MTVVLATFNAPGYSLPAYGLAALHAYLSSRAPARTPTIVRTLTFQALSPPSLAASAIVYHRPRLIGLSCYVWNSSQIVRLLPFSSACFRPFRSLSAGRTSRGAIRSSLGRSPTGSSSIS